MADPIPKPYMPLPSSAPELSHWSDDSDNEYYSDDYSSDEDCNDEDEARNDVETSSWVRVEEECGNHENVGDALR
jgi:hypothetical protein